MGYARGAFDALAGVVYDFCVGRAAQYPNAFLQDWTGTLVRDEYKGYESVVSRLPPDSYFPYQPVFDVYLFDFD